MRALPSFFLCVFLLFLFSLLGAYSYYQYDLLYTSYQVIDGTERYIEKLRGFPNTLNETHFSFYSGGYTHLVVNPSREPIRTPRLGDAAVYVYDTGENYVLVYAEYYDFIFFKYLFSFSALMFVLVMMYQDYIHQRGEVNG